MRKAKTSAAALMIVLLTVILLSACTPTLTKRQKDAAGAFSKVTSLLPVEEKDGWYQLTTPDGGAKLAFSNSCLCLAVDATPFIAAGMDAALCNNMRESVFYKNDIGFSLPGWDMLNQNVKHTAVAQFEANMRYLEITQTDETYKITFAGEDNTHPDGAAFEWTKDIQQTGYDVIFTLDAEPLLAVGGRPEDVLGWEYVQISVKLNGKVEQVWKFQKSLNIG